MQPDLRSTTPIVQRADDAPDVEFRPPAPVPHRRPLNVAEFVLTAFRNPLELWGARAYSEPVVRANWLGTPTIIVSDPAAIRYLLVENADNYVMQPLRQRVLRPILRDGLLTAEGALWRRTRRAIAPIFAPRNIAGLAPVMRDTAEHFATALGRAGEVCDLSVEMTRLTYEILQATLFSGDIAGEPAEFAAAVAKLLRTMGHVDPLDILDAPAFLPRPTRALGRRSERYFRALIAATIERRQQALARGGAAPNDLLTLLLGAKDLARSEIEDNIVTFIGAGHETTSRALGWTLYLLSQAPGERALVEAEIDSELDSLDEPALWLQRLVHTRAAFEEAMRLYPPAPSLNRSAVAADRFGEVDIPAGASVLVLPWIVHRHEKLWADPNLFRPARFRPGQRDNIDRYQYLPFGVGPRTCIGQSFAMQEGIIALALLMRRLRFDYAGVRPPLPVQKITVQPDIPLLMHVSARR